MEQQKQIGNKFGNNMTNLQRVITHCLNCHLVALLPQLQTVVLTVHVRPIKYSKLHIYHLKESLFQRYQNILALNVAFFPLLCGSETDHVVSSHTHFASHVSPRLQTL